MLKNKRAQGKIIGMTLNACEFYRHKDIVKFLEDFVIKSSPDFILLQEIPDVVDLNKVFLDKYTILVGIEPKKKKVAILFKKTAVIVIEVVDCTSDLWEERFASRFLISVISIENRKYIVVNSHPRAFIVFLRRIHELEGMAKIVENLKVKHKTSLVIWGGDFNSMFAFEENIHSRIIGNEMKLFADYEGYSFESRFLEPSNLANILAQKASSLGINIKKKLDKFYISNGICKQFEIIIKKHEVVVSDHYPIEIVFNRK